MSDRAKFIIQPRDQMILEYLAKFEFAPTKLLGYWCGYTNMRHLYRRLAGLRESKLISSQQLVVGTSFWKLTNQGFAFIGAPTRRTKAIKLGNVEHYLGVQTILCLYGHLAGRLSLDDIILESELRRKTKTYQFGAHLPDAIFFDKRQGKYIYIDYERSKKSDKRYDEIFGFLTKTHVFAKLDMNGDPVRHMPTKKVQSLWIAPVTSRGPIIESLQSAEKRQHKNYNDDYQWNIDFKYQPFEKVQKIIDSCFDEKGHIHRGFDGKGNPVANPFLPERATDISFYQVLKEFAKTTK